MIQTVVKRDGRIVGFNEQKIMAAILGNPQEPAPDDDSEMMND